MDPFLKALGPHLATSEKNCDVSLAWRCPKCEAVREFVLIETKGDIKVVGVELGSPVILLDLRCRDCSYEFNVPPGELTLVRQAGELTIALRSGSISAEFYAEKLRALPARFMRDMIALTDEWSCPKCGEKNPVTFDTCWKCQFNTNVTSV